MKTRVTKSEIPHARTAIWGDGIYDFVPDPNGKPIVQVSVAVALREAGLCKSASEARRMMQQGGVEIDGRLVTDPDAVFLLEDPGE